MSLRRRISCSQLRSVCAAELIALELPASRGCPCDWAKKKKEEKEEACLLPLLLLALSLPLHWFPLGWVSWSVLLQSCLCCLQSGTLKIPYFPLCMDPCRISHCLSAIKPPSSQSVTLTNHKRPCSQHTLTGNKALGNYTDCRQTITGLMVQAMIFKTMQQNRGSERLRGHYCGEKRVGYKTTWWGFSALSKSLYLSPSGLKPFLPWRC